MARKLDRQTLDELGIDAALAQANKSRREGGIPIGSALMDPTGTIVALGHNLRVQSGDPTAHAEVVCMRNAGRRRDWRFLTLYSTLSPCVMCTGTTLLHRVPRVVIGENSTFVGGEELFAAHGVELVNLNDQRCVALMKAFIESSPDLWQEDIGDPEA